MGGTKTDPACPVWDKFHISSYLTFHLDADERSGRGEEQLYCFSCDRYVWPDHAKGCPKFKGELKK